MSQPTNELPTSLRELFAGNGQGVSVISMPLPGQRAMPFKAMAFTSERGGSEINLSDFAGRWVVLASFPGAAARRNPNGLIAFLNAESRFREMNCQLIGLSDLPDPLNYADWAQAPKESGGLGDVSFPLACDTNGEIARRYGLWRPMQSGAELITYTVIDPNGTACRSGATPLSQPDVEQILGEIMRLQSPAGPASSGAADRSGNLEKQMNELTGALKQVSELAEALKAAQERIQKLEER
jgi:peroxiredoxin (alkyl hydroperoxide reductase subunit C)